MGTLVTKESVLLMTDQPETVPPLVRALEARGYRVIVVLTFGDALAWLEVETSYCLIVQLSTFTATDIAILCAHRTWAKRGPLVVVTSVPAPASLRHALEDGAFSVVPLSEPPYVHASTILTAAFHADTPCTPRSGSAM